MPTLLTHHRFWMQATWYFQSFWSTFMRLWALVTSVLRMFPLCRRLPRQGFPPAPPKAFRAWGGWGEWGPPIRALSTWEWPLPLNVLTAERRLGRRVSIIRLPLSGSAPGGRLVLGSLSGPSAPGTAPAPAGEHPEVPHQCPDGPPLS